MNVKIHIMTAELAVKESLTILNNLDENGFYTVPPRKRALPKNSGFSFNSRHLR